MKKVPYYFLSLFLVLFFVSCADSSENVETSSHNMEPIRVASQSSNDTLSEDSNTWILDEDHFVKFLEGSGIVDFFYRPIDHIDYLQYDGMGFATNGVLTWTANYYYDTEGLEKSRDANTDNFGFTVAEIQEISSELLGFEVNYTGNTTEDGLIWRTWGFSHGHKGEVDYDSIKQDDDRITFECDYIWTPAFDKPGWKMKFTFNYLPDGKYTKYQFVGTEFLEGDINDFPIPPKVMPRTLNEKETAAEMNLRRGPSTDYDPPIVIMPAGSFVDVIGCESNFDDEWLYVRYYLPTPSQGENVVGSMEGWVNSKYLQEISSSNN